MSLLEDIFLQDEADEAQQLERVIEGDEYERPRSRSRSPENSDENEPKDDEAEEEKRRVDPSSTKSKRVTKNPRFILNPARLTGPRGIQILPDHFKDFKFKGKGHEKEDLDMVLKKLEHWAYRLYPKFQFEDCLKKIESLGKKRPVMVHLQKIRTDQFISEDTVVQKDSSDEETQPAQEPDEFDKLLQQQIDLARATPAPGSVRKVMATPMKDRSPFTMPKATSSPSISDDQKERMMRNRKLAEERRLARLKQTSLETSGKQDNVIIEVDEEEENNVAAKKHSRSHVVDSSDDECGATSVNVNQIVTVHVHNDTGTKEDSNDNSKVEQDNVIIDLDEEVESNVAAKKHSRSHVVDSSDDKPGVTFANQSVTFHVHNDTETEEDSNDIEMTDKNERRDVDQEIIDIDKGTTRDVRAIEQSGEAVEIIEINDPTDRVIKRNNQSIDVGDIIEIDDESNQGVNEEIDNQNNEVDGVIEINDPVATDVGQSRISNDSEELKENDNTSTVDVDISKALTPEVIDTGKQSKSPSNHNEDKIEEIQDGTKDSSSNKVDDLEKNVQISEEVLEDIMDVDFNDDF